MKATAISIVKRLREAGHTAWFNGGCVRDMVRGVEPERGSVRFLLSWCVDNATRSAQPTIWLARLLARTRWLAR